MIKDSKLIGTKLSAPFGWKKFKVGELFDMHSPSGNDLYSSADGIKFDKDDFVRCTTSSRDCNGVPICLPRSSFSEILERGLSVASNGDAGSVFYHDNEFAILQDSYALTLKSDNDKISDFTYLFLCAVLNKQSDLFSYTTKAVWKRYNILEIELPVTTDNQPDFEWMSDYIKAVKADYLEQKALSNRNEIEAYLAAGKVASTDVTDDDRQFLRDFAKLPRRKFKVGELFDIKLSRSDNKLVELSKGDIPLISAGSDNQGIVGYISSDLLNTVPFKNSITADMFGNWFLHVGDFYAVSHGRVNILVPKFMFNELFCEYICALGSKCTFGYYGFDNMLSSKKLSDIVLELPVVDSSQVDVDSIEKYMQIQSKPLINKVAETLVPVRGGGQL